MPVEDGIKSKMSIHSSGFNESKSAEKINISIKKCKNLVRQIKTKKWKNEKKK